MRFSRRFVLSTLNLAIAVFGWELLYRNVIRGVDSRVWLGAFWLAAILGFLVARSNRIDGVRKAASAWEAWQWACTMIEYGASRQYVRTVTDPHVALSQKASLQRQLWKAHLIVYATALGWFLEIVVCFVSVLAGGVESIRLMLLQPLYGILVGHLAGWASGLLWRSVAISAQRRLVESPRRQY